MKFIFLISIFFVGCTTTKRSSASIDLNEIIKKYDLPALGYLISDLDKTTSLEVAGRRDIYEDYQVTRDDKFHLGSNSKVITATLFALLVEESEFSWTSKISDFTPFGYHLHPTLSKLTFIDLFRHRSGMDANAYSELWMKLWGMEDENKSGEIQRDLLAEHYLQNKPQSAVGEFKYSNVGYSIAGFIIEKKLGTPFEQLVQKYIFEKLKMNSCSYGAKGDDVPKGHKVVKGKRLSYHGGNPQVYSPAGRISCSLEDWAKLARFHLGKYLAKDPNFKYFYEAPKGHYYSTGFVITKNGSFAHEGNNTLNHAIINIDPKKQKIVLVVTNDGDNDRGVKGSQELFDLLVSSDEL